MRIFPGYATKPSTMSEKTHKSSNILRIYNRLRQSPVTLDVLHDWTKRTGMNVSRRTLYRYLDDLAESIAFPGEKIVVIEGENNKKVWKIEFEKSATSLNQFDINSYYFLRNFVPQSLSAPREQSLQKLDQLVYATASKSRFEINVDANQMGFIRTDYIDALYNEQDHIFLEDIIWAIQQHRKISIENINFDIKYFPEGFAAKMMVFPLRLIYHFGMIYVGVFSPDVNRIIILPFNDIVKSSVTNDVFNPAAYYPLLDAYLANTFGITPNINDEIYDISLEFAGFTGQYIRQMNWHASQRFEEKKDGNLLLHLRCGLNRELLGFVLYFLHNVRVLQPLKLRDMVTERIKMIQDIYAKDELEYVSNYTKAT